jgi:uncharacterized membrane protein
MESQLKFAGHALHQELVVFPLGMLGGAAIFDAIGLSTKSGRWHRTAHHMMAAGLVSIAPTAVAGLVDWLAIPNDTRAKSVGIWHGLGNVLVGGLFAASWALRAKQPARPGGAAWLSIGGFALAGVTAWLGGELVARLGVGIDDGAHLNAPNSLTHRSVSEEGAEGEGTVVTYHSDTGFISTPIPSSAP